MEAKRFSIVFLLLFLMLLFLACEQSSETEIQDPLPEATGSQKTSNSDDADSDQAEVPHPTGWENDTHGKKADPNFDMVFPEDKVNRLDITIKAEDWQAMMNNMAELWGQRRDNITANEQAPGCGGQEETPAAPAEEEKEDEPGCGFGFPDKNPVYKPCTMAFEGKTWHHVGIRFKGNSSLQASWRSGSYKFPLRLTMDEFEKDFPEIKNQRFYGFQKLSLSSNYSDPSYLCEKVTADIFRNAGIPAPHTAFYRIFIDYGEGSKYFGLYTMVEIPDDPLLETQFSDKGGNLYKPTGSGATFATYDEESFDKETNKKEADFSDVRGLYDALNASRTNALTWRTNLEKTLNVDGFLHWLAVNTTIQNWDTYGMMSQNYYLYNDPADPQLHWIPYDNNMALIGSSKRSLSLELTARQVGDRWPLIRYLIDDPVYKAVYADYVKKTIDSVFTPKRMQPIYKAAHDMIRPFVVGNEGEVSGYTMLSKKEYFDQGLEALNKHVESRYQAAQNFLKAN